MSAIIRPSPRYKKVSLFATCMVDMIFPHVGVSTVALFDHLGIEVAYRQAQTCCGQPAFNAGFWPDARPIARRFMETFADAELIVTPSGSCASMVHHYYPTLFENDPIMLERANRLASITWELSEYLVDGLGIESIGGMLEPTTVAFHHACHGLRLMHLDAQGRKLVENIDGVTVVEMIGSNECCGFGGLFAVKMPEISSAMLSNKIENIKASNADIIITGDCGCLAQMNGGLSRGKESQRVMHLADLLTLSLKDVYKPSH